MRRVTVMEWERVVRYERGRLVGVLEPGRHWVRGPSRLLRVDLRQRTLTMPLQEVLTTDGLAVRLSLAAQWRVVDAVAFVSTAESAPDALYVQLQLALRAPVAATPVADLVADRGAVLDQVVDAVRPAALSLGIALDRVAVRDLTFPAELRSLFAEVVRARQESLASLERARGEQAALRSLANTAALIEQHPSLLRLRTLQAVEAGRATVLLHEQPQG